MTDWATYLAGFHARNAGISEDVLTRARSGDLTPYRWLARAVSGTRVLDLASGSGIMADTLAELSRIRPWVVGLDLSAAELVEARRRGRTNPQVRADAATLPFADASFDAVVSSAGLMVVGRVPRVLDEAARVLRPGGVLAATVASAVPLRPQDMRFLAPLTARLRSTPQFPGGGEMTGLTSSLEQAGFRVLEDARERFGFLVRTDADARLLTRALYLPDTPDRRRELAAAWLAERAAAQPEGVEIAVPVRRVVAMRTGYGG
ncbi:MAG: class I SAM-dependent methyltransferase [Actinomycetota bacterium]|nr:class I SAM-dependent methyltransferase [Actinomycetota bacterium]